MTDVQVIGEWAVAFALAWAASGPLDRLFALLGGGGR